MKRFLVVVASLFACFTLSAEVILPSVLSDNMVLQRNTSVSLWGKAAPGAKVTVKPSWKGATRTSVVSDGQTGEWMLNIDTPDAGGPYEIVISDGKAVTLKNILIGEVWLCSGQSNMNMPMVGYNTQPVEGASLVIAQAHPQRQIRICNVKLAASKTRLSESEGSWTENTPAAVANCSAVAYFFADALQKSLDIPVGIICSSYGGTNIETWIPSEDMSANFPGMAGIRVQSGINAPSMVFNGQIAPLVPYTFKGMIWYQGESNRVIYDSDELYPKLAQIFVGAMRREFRNPEMPFYFCQICPYSYSRANAFRNGYFWEAQTKIPSVVENSYMITTCDVGKIGTNHPPQKKEIGERFALSAMQHTYGCEAIQMDPPVLKSFKVDGSRIICTFDVEDHGLSPRNCDLDGFEIAGEDRVFHKAIGRISVNDAHRKQVYVSSDEVPAPVAVRYCFRNYSAGTVYNSFGMPLAPFRTDNWDDLKE